MTPPSDTPLTPPVTPPSGGPPTVTLRQAAELCKVSLSTMRRHRDQLEQLGARTDSRGGWHIPIPALVTAGLLDRVTPPDAPSPPVMTPPCDAPLTPPMTPSVRELDELRAQLAQAEQRAQIAEAIAAERDRVIAAQERTLRMLEARPAPAPEAAASLVEPPAFPPAPELEPETGARSSFWRRWFG